MSKSKPSGRPRQLELPFRPRASPKCVSDSPEPVVEAAGAGLRLIRGEGQKRQERLDNRDAVIRVLLEAGADLLLRRISSERAEHIEKCVNHVLDLFDKVDDVPHLLPILKRELEGLESLMTETRRTKSRRPG